MKIIKIFLILLVLFIAVGAVSAEGNFTSLQNEIDASAESIEITQDYAYDNTTDYKVNEGILINKTNYMINGNGYTIDGSNQARIFKIIGNNITISNLNFINGNMTGDLGGAIYSSGSITLNNVTFKDNYADYGGAIYVSKQCIINNALFSENTVSNDGGAIVALERITINKTIFESNTAPTSGGAIYSIGITTINNSKFIKNKGEFGGAINTWTYTTINNTELADNNAEYGGAVYVAGKTTINNVTLTNNIASENGGAISARDETTINDAIFFNNNAENGGAIFTNGNSNLIKCLFENNTANGGGGAVYFNKNITNTKISSTFKGNKAAKSGGAIFIRSSAQNNQIESTFIENEASYGAGMFFYNEANNNTFKSDFINNTAISCGGAMFFYSKTDCNTFKGNYINNRANGLIDENNGNGGAITFKDTSKNSIFNCNFTNNTARLYGGAVNYKQTPYNITFNCDFISNNARYGGGLNFFDGFDNITFNSNFIANNATIGGAIYAAGECIINNATFNSNIAYIGGAIYATGKTTINNTRFTGNYAMDGGGAIYFRNNTLSINNVIFENNFSPYADAIGGYDNTLSLKNATFINNETNYGLIRLRDTLILIENVTFENTISNYTTALYLENCSGKIKKSNFINLTAKFTGGAIVIKSISDEITLENCRFIDVTSKNNGGAIYTDVDNLENKKVANSLNVINTEFNNCSSRFGGAILQLNGKLNIEESKFINNNAQISGGAIYASTIDLNLKNSEFINNSAFKNGGAIYIELTNSTFDNTSFIGNEVENSSTTNPNTVYAYDTSLYIKNSLFNNSKHSISSFFTVEYLDENNTVNEDEFDWDNKIYTTVIVNEGLDIKLAKNSIDVTSIPSKFDLREWGWVTPVKNQGSKGYCWVMGTVGVLESNIFKATDTEYDFSENNIGNNGIMYSRYGNSRNLEGGLMTTVSGLILSWLDPIPEEDEPYDEYAKVSDILDTQNKIHIQDVFFIPVKRTTNYIVSNETNTLIKQALLKYGAVTTKYAEDSNYYKGETTSIYHSDVYGSNHITSFVGWDDSYSKDNFNSPPPGDGAWIMKNSWGDTWGDNGYAYISYYDTSLLGPDLDGEYTIPYTLAFIIENTENYKYNYQTDIGGLNRFNENYTYYSNEYTAIKNNLIGAVGTYFNDTGVDYEFKVYVNDELKHTQNGTSEFAGFKTIKLNEYIPVKENDVFKVVFKNNVLPQQNNSRQHYMENVSFVSADGINWIDYAPLNRTVCLKVYAFDLDIYTEDLVKIYKNDSQFVADVGETGVKVTFEINGINYTRTSDENGTAKMAINLNPGNYTIKTTFNGTTVENTITVLPTLISENLVKYYRNASQFYISLIDGEGNPVSGVNITMNINGIFYDRLTNENGTAKLNINLEPGEYILTAIDPLTGLMMSYNITVLPVLNATNLEMKYMDGSTFNVTVLDGWGNPLANAKVTFNVNGVFYTRTTDSSGIAKLNIRLMAGEYIITSEYDGMAIANTITIKD